MISVISKAKRKRSLLHCDEQLDDSPAAETGKHSVRRLLFSPSPIIVLPPGKRRRVRQHESAYKNNTNSKREPISRSTATPSFDVSTRHKSIDVKCGVSFCRPQADASFEQAAAAEQEPIAAPKVQLHQPRALLWLPDRWIDPLSTSTPYDHIDADNVRHTGSRLMHFLQVRRDKFCDRRRNTINDIVALCDHNEAPQQQKQAHDRLERLRFLRKRRQNLTDTIDAMTDWQIELYVVQAIDWALALRNGARNLTGESKDCLLAITMACLSLVLKQHHAETNNYLALHLSECAKFFNCETAVFAELERALLSAVDFDVLRFKDAYTCLFTGNLAESNKQYRGFSVPDNDWLRLCVRLLRTMIVDQVEKFVFYSPEIRAEAALAVISDGFESQNAGADLLSACAELEQQQQWH